ncbi:BTAD domain-containing putative transcriptional regulator [Streptomyces heilongjiangensis]|uniref:BTAD domain-containing putative transcriptional regulator n=1 Tax=Streptomyces heilongjiangensis TaxID=945052 RepID=A0ABW1BH49_9ACTN|nr:BTAD domain-containing putative transcriptional regulator [Streptomyces heilongjiangensis]MDC2952647.1 BTAD domain-containing putative transcriptional regulator [Streptomyces heilongjiangensis]
MDIHLLGPLALVIDGQPCDLPSRAECSVLARLVLTAGKLVTADTLIDALWADRLPADPGNALQIRVSKLRRALAAMGAPPDLIVTRPPGYLLQVGPEHVDLHRFTRLVADARHLAIHAPTEAVLRYEEALGLWRGPALVNFIDEPWATTEATRLEELRLTAQEERVDLLLTLGRHAELVAELEFLTGEHPLRERMQGQLMRALYGAGRQAQALEVYHRTRVMLDAELGLEPSAELRALEQAILRQDPALHTARQPEHRRAGNLPARLKSFVGRDAELGRLHEMLGEHRLVTLTGMGGVGKTTLAVEAAQEFTDRLDGVWIVRLAPVTDPARVAAAAADSLGVAHGAEDAGPNLISMLRTRSALLLLDNCEHLVQACAELAEELLAACPGLRILATSREPLGLTGEAHYPLLPMDVPPQGTELTRAQEYDAVRLFCDRARNAHPSFAPHADDVSAVTRICRALDGIPLALELAAAWTRSLPVAEIEVRLNDRFAFLDNGPRTASARQRTLRAAVDWSYDLLSGPERALLRRLSVFRGGFELRAAEQVCEAGEVRREEVVSLLRHLVDHSLVVPGSGPRARFRLLETLRQYAATRLRESGEEAAVTDAHVAYYARTVETAKSETRGPGQSEWLSWLSAERDNLRTALHRARATAGADPDRGLHFVASLGWLWYFASHREGVDEITAMLDAAGTAGARARGLALQTQALVGRPGACVVHPDPACAVAAEESLRLLVEAGDEYNAAYSRLFLAVEGASGKNTGTCLAQAAQATGVLRDQRDRWGTALGSFVEMELRFALGTFDRAAECGERALADFRGVGDHWGTSAIQYHLGMALHRAGRLRQALVAYQGAWADGRRIGLANTVQYALANMGHVELNLQDARTAQQHFEESHQTARALGARGNPLAALGQAYLARQQGDLPTAARHAEAVLEYLAGQDKPDWSAAALTCLGHVAELSGDLALAEERHRQARATAARTPGSPAVASAAEGLACGCAALGDGSAATRLLSEAARHRRMHHTPPSPLESQDIERASLRARSLLGDDVYRRIYAEASDMVADGRVSAQAAD